MQTLAALRAELDTVDEQLISVIARRQSLVAEIGRTKRAAGRQLRDFKREREVIEHVRAAAQGKGLNPDLGESLMRALIDASLTTQEQQGITAHAAGDGLRALVLGGNGRMGRWFASFLDQQGFQVDVCDPSGAPDGFNRWVGPPTQVHDLIVVAAPLGESNAVMLALSEQAPRAVVLEIASIKEPLKPGIAALQAAGVAVASLHPLFGPAVNLLAGKHVILCDLGSDRANALARSLFTPTMATISEVPLDEHDQLMAWILALSHLSNLVFAQAIGQSGISAESLKRCASSTFERQTRIAADVVQESAQLYFEIQRANPHNAVARQALKTALSAYVDAIENGDAAEFAALMQGSAGFMQALA